MKVKLSAVIITLNEAQNIRRCINSLQNVADEILIIDSFSTDSTKDICLELGATFITHPFENYSKQKKYATSQAQYDYILSLDADEALDQKLQEEITKIKQNWKADGYTFNILPNYAGKWIYHSGWHPCRKLRLFDRNKGNWSDSPIHESVVMNSSATTTHISGNLLHYSYYSISEHIERMNKYTTLSAQTYKDQGRKSNLLQILIRPPWQFFRDYILKLGILDGKEGLIICMITAFGVFLKYTKLYKLIR